MKITRDSIGRIVHVKFDIGIKKGLLVGCSSSSLLIAGKKKSIKTLYPKVLFFPDSSENSIEGFIRRITVDSIVKIGKKLLTN